MDWSVYIIICSDGSLYTGISTDVARRFRQHQSGKGAKYFRSRQPVTIAYQESGYSRIIASQRENQIKKLSRMAKLALIDTPSNQENKAKIERQPRTNIDFQPPNTTAAGIS